MTEIDLYALLLFLAGAALLYWGKRRAYLRMKALDRAPVPSYGAMLAAKLADGLLVVIGGSLLAAAAVMLAIEYAGEWLALCVILYIAFLFEREWYERRR